MPSVETTKDVLRSVVYYDPETGEFTWLQRPGTERLTKSWNTKYAGKKVALSLNKDGYFYIKFRINGENHQNSAHRFAWLYMTGEMPTLVVDHINRIKTDNKFSNLRLASISQNGHNVDARQNNSSGVKGVWWDSRRDQWVAEIKVNSEKIFIGRFSDFHEAKAARVAASKKYAGEFSVLESTVLVSMTPEESARRWLVQRNLCAIDWQTLEQLCEVYREHGSKSLIFDANGPTYTLRETSAPQSWDEPAKLKPDGSPIPDHIFSGIR